MTRTATLDLTDQFTKSLIAELDDVKTTNAALLLALKVIPERVLNTYLTPLQIGFITKPGSRS